MKKFDSKAVSLKPGMSVSDLLSQVDSLLVDHGIELIEVSMPSGGTLVMTNNLVTETVVMESAPTTILSQKEREGFSKSRLPG